MTETGIEPRYPGPFLNTLLNLNHKFDKYQ